MVKGTGPWWRGNCAVKMQEKLNFIQSDGIIVNIFFLLSHWLIIKFKKFHWLENWQFDVTSAHSIFILLLMIKISQSQSKKLICYCKNKFFSNPQPNLCLQFYNNVNGVRYFKTREHFLNSRTEFAGLQPSHVLSSTCVPVEPCTSYFHDTFSFLFTYLFC